LAFVRFYLAGSIVVGLLLVADSVSLFFGPAGTVNLVISALEYLWLLLSVAAIVLLVREELPILVPVSYVVYAMLSAILAFYLVYRGVDPENLRLPAWIIIAFVIYGLFFATASYRQHRSMRPPGAT
jgi:hypothetical protein